METHRITPDTASPQALHLQAAVMGIYRRQRSLWAG